MNTFALIKTLIQNVRRNEEGVTALEYGLIAALIAGVIVVAVTSIGTAMSTTFTTLAGKL